MIVIYKYISNIRKDVLDEYKKTELINHHLSIFLHFYLIIKTQYHDIYFLSSFLTILSRARYLFALWMSLLHPSKHLYWLYYRRQVVARLWNAAVRPQSDLRRGHELPEWGASGGRAETDHGPDRGHAAARL